MVITGQTNNSRLSELRKYVVSDDITKLYIGNGGWTINGVDFSSLIYSQEEPTYRTSGDGEDDLRTYDGENLRATTSPLLLQVTYYIDGIKYTDYVQEGYTIFEYYATDSNSPNFINVPYYKDPKKENIISLPKIDNDVFIIRQQLSVFENNNLLEYVDNLLELRTFVGGNYFNIVNNT